ncbi:MAG: Holliday junction branch migration protein RuvA [Actinomycetota bacterium]
MIASLTGKVAAFSSGAVELEVGGVGYLVNVPASLLAELRLGQKVRMLTHMVVREDSMTLFGFAGPEDRDLFLTLLSVTGVGPKLAIGILGTLPPEVFRRAVASGDIVALTSVSGLGKRGAERIVLELKERLGVGTVSAEDQSKMAEVREALMGLGYSAMELREVLDRVLDQAGDGVEVGGLVKAALRELSRT